MNTNMKMYVMLLACTLPLACSYDNTPGPQGIPGVQGEVGQAGTDGSCNVAALDVGSEVAPNGGSLITCSDGSSSVVLNGATGSQGEVGETGATGQTGSQGQQGQVGQTGAQGIQGNAGLNGSNGTPGTVVTPVQFCPGFKQSYPSTFAESGICIGNTMYGVYSANGGFLAALPPGEYSSDGIDASCNFALEANCVVH